MTIRILHILMALLLIAAPSPHAMLNAQELEWVKGVGGSGDGFGLAIAVDASGNNHVTGTFTGTVVFGDGEDNETELTAASGAFLAKYAPDGTLIWARSIARPAGFGIALDVAGNIYVAQNLGIAKYTSNGIFVWATSGTGTGSSSGVAVDAAGDIHVVGTFSETVVFGEGEDNETILIPVGARDIFVARYNSDGDLLWAKAFGTLAFDSGNGIATDAGGNSYVIGSLSNSESAIIAKFAPNGLLVWVTNPRVVSPAPIQGGFVHGEGIAVDTSGNIHVTGAFAGTVVFGEGDENATELSVQFVAIFIAKYDPGGSLVWARQDGSPSFGLAIAVDAAGNIHITGEIAIGTAVFGAGETNETSLSAGGVSAAFFIAKYAPDGVLMWARGADAVDADPLETDSDGTGLGIAVDTAGSSIATGGVAGTAVFGSGESNETTLAAEKGVRKIFVAKYAAGVGHDSDGDGVPDDLDFCPATILPETVPTTGRLLPNRFAITDEGLAFSTNARGAGKNVSFSIHDTRGCSCEQIIDYLGLGQGHRMHGCSIGVIRSFIERLPE